MSNLIAKFEKQVLEAHEKLFKKGAVSRLAFIQAKDSLLAVTKVLTQSETTLSTKNASVVEQLEEEKESEQSNVNKPKPRVLYGGDVQEEKKIKQDDNNFYVKKNYLGIPAHFPIDHNKGCSEYISKFLPFKKSNGE